MVAAVRLMWLPRLPVGVKGGPIGMHLGVNIV